MRLRISAQAARRSAWLAAVTRTFCGLAVSGGLHNGAWIAALAGSLLAVPILAGLNALMSGRPAFRGGPAGRLLMFALAAALLADTAYALGILSDSAVFLAPEDTGALLPLLFAAAALVWVVTRNGDAVGFGAALWLKLLPLLLLPVIALQLPHFRPHWVFPLLGEGPRALAISAVRAAGWMAAAFSASILLCDAPPDRGARGLPRALLSCGALAAGLILLRLMMTPAMPGALGSGWLTRLDALVTNGRAPLYVQLPMVLLWNICLMNLAAFDGFASAALLQRLFPRLDGRICGALAVGAALLIVQRAHPESSAPWEWAPAAASASVLLSILLSRGVRAHA